MRLLAVTDAMPQKNWRDDGDEHEELGRASTDGAGDQPRRGVDEERVVRRRRRRSARTASGRPWACACVIARLRKKRGDRRDVDRPDDRLRRLGAGADRLLADVCRGVEPGDRVLRQQQAEARTGRPRRTRRRSSRSDPAAPGRSTELEPAGVVGRRSSARTKMITTPTTCHHTLMSPRILITLHAERVEQPVGDQHEQEDARRCRATVSWKPSSNMRMK